LQLILIKQNADQSLHTEKTRDIAITPSNTTPFSNDIVCEAGPYALHAGETGSSSGIASTYHTTVDTGFSVRSSSTLPSRPLNPIIPVNQGDANTLQEGSIKDSQEPTFTSDWSSFSNILTSQPTLLPNAIFSAEGRGIPSEIGVQAQIPRGDGFANPLLITNPTAVGGWSSMETAINYNLEDIEGFHGPQVFPTQMNYPQMASITFPSPLGYPFQMYTPPRPRIYCAWPLCMESFARPGDLERHRQSVHLGIKHHCFWPGCHNNHGRGYVRCDKLRAHQKEKHGFA
jgi:hypothetical protein